MKHKVIDNFLEEDYFDSLVSLFEKISWYFQREVNPNHDVAKDNLFYMTHMFYDNNTPMSNFYEFLIPVLEKLEVKCLIRAKGNLYPHTEILHIHPPHMDYTFSHSAAIFSLNTCDGYTMLEDGTKIESVANRILLFDASKKYCSTTTTNESARINININYLQP